MNRYKEIFFHWLFVVLGFSALAFLLAITLLIFKEALPIFKHTPFWAFISGQFWYPTYEPPDFGILPLILASFLVTLGAVVVAAPLGIGTALYLTELAGRRQRAFLKPLLEILAGVPSVVYGFFGMVVLAPFFQKAFQLPTGLCALTASLTLGIMSIPFICSLVEDALSVVPRMFREASLALGANHWQTLTRVVIPAAGSGISTAVILGISRSIGETMTVLMVAGGAAVIPKSFLQPVRPMTATIAAEMAEAPFGSAHYHALFGIAAVLFVLTLIFNVLAEAVCQRFRQKLGSKL
ncbi:MAG: phosphate ABC transporter permease subunit PstC [Candidatus Omnitrophica bacterium]|nr:phosphate ABC transporter permease subunit PstC [Candidatus Omnitrophota bacterium]